MKNIRITFRLNPYQLARALQTVRQLEPTYKLTSLNDLVKTIYHDYLAKMTLNKLDEVPTNLLDEITNFNKIGGQLTLAELIKIQKTESKTALKSSKEIMNKKASNFDDPNKSDSDISALTDFSPPKNWNK